MASARAAVGMCRFIKRPVMIEAGRSRFGDMILVLFLTAQVLDGALTYVGVLTFGAPIERNPLLAWSMGTLGIGPTLAGAKILAGSCGIALHVTSLHRTVGLLTLVYIALAIVPWTSLLFFAN